MSVADRCRLEGLMFDLITGTQERPLRERSLTSKIVAAVAHILIILVILGIPLLMATSQLPDVPTMMAFVAPPPGAAPAPRAVQPVPTTGQFAAPVEAPRNVQPEREAPEVVSSAGALGGV